jgi:hypothetical protein
MTQQRQGPENNPKRDQRPSKNTPRFRPCSRLSTSRTPQASLWITKTNVEPDFSAAC